MLRAPSLLKQLSWNVRAAALPENLMCLLFPAGAEAALRQV